MPHDTPLLPDLDDTSEDLLRARAGRQTIALLVHLRRDDREGADVILSDLTRTRNAAVWGLLDLATALLIKFDQDPPEMIDRVLDEQLAHAARLEHELETAAGST